MYAIRSYYDETQRQYVATLQASGRSLLTIIDSILDFSKIEAGQLELERIPFNLDDVLESRITSYNVCYTKLLRIGRRTVAIALSIQPDDGREVEQHPSLEVRGTEFSQIIVAQHQRGLHRLRFHESASHGERERVITSYSIHYTKLYDAADHFLGRQHDRGKLFRRGSRRHVGPIQ